jgi:hypothetical protein
LSTAGFTQLVVTVAVQFGFRLKIVRGNPPPPGRSGWSGATISIGVQSFTPRFRLSVMSRLWKVRRW